MPGMVLLAGSLDFNPTFYSYFWKSRTIVSYVLSDEGMNAMLQQMLYRGPSRQMLHEGYAKHGRIDDQAPITTSSDVVIDAPLDRVWAQLINLPAWPTITPSIRDVRLESVIEVDA